MSTHDILERKNRPAPDYPKMAQRAWQLGLVFVAGGILAVWLIGPAWVQMVEGGIILVVAGQFMQQALKEKMFVVRERGEL